MLSFDRWFAFVTHDIVKYLLAAGGLYFLVYGLLAGPPGCTAAAVTSR